MGESEPFVSANSGPCKTIPCSNICMRQALAVLFLLCASILLAQTPAPAAPAPAPAEDYSGTYSFLKEGEFIQVTVEDNGTVNGFISRYGDSDNDRDTFLDHFFKEGKLQDKKLTFLTKTVHGVWYEFKGSVERGEGKNPGDEAYYLLKGTLVQYRTDAEKKTTSKSSGVVFKSFPQNLDIPNQP